MGTGLYNCVKTWIKASPDQLLLQKQSGLVWLVGFSFSLLKMRNMAGAAWAARESELSLSSPSPPGMVAKPRMLVEVMHTQTAMGRAGWPCMAHTKTCPKLPPSPKLGSLMPRWSQSQAGGSTLLAWQLQLYSLDRTVKGLRKSQQQQPQCRPWGAHISAFPTKAVPASSPASASSILAARKRA